jgi:hypothetical protein
MSKKECGWSWKTKKGAVEDVWDNFGFQTIDEVFVEAKEQAKKWDLMFPKKKHWVRRGKKKVFIYSKPRKKRY